MCLVPRHLTQPSPRAARFPMTRLLQRHVRGWSSDLDGNRSHKLRNSVANDSL